MANLLSENNLSDVENASTSRENLDVYSKNEVKELLSSSEDGLGDALVAVKQPVAGAVVRTQHDKNTDHITVMDFGAKGDGVTDDTLSIQAALDYQKTQYAAGTRQAVYLPPGIYMVSGLTIYAFTVMFGSGRSTVLRRIIGSSTSVITGINSESLWGYTGVDATEFAYGFELHSMVIDGNVDGVTNKFSDSLAGHGIAIWGGRYRLFNIDIVNCAECGMRTDYKDQNLDYTAPWFEASIYSIRIFNCGKEGWRCAGQHDSAIHDVSIINGSRLGNALYDGFWAESTMSGNIGNIHVSNGEDLMETGMTTRHRYAGNIEGPCRFYGGTTFEGAQTCVRIAASGIQFEDSCTFYIPWGDGYNGTVMYIEPGTAFCRIRGKLSGAGTYKPNQTNWGIRFITGSAGTISHNDIDVIIEGCQIPISFGDSTTAPDADGGKNRINIIAYYGDSNGYPGTYGVPNTANSTQLNIMLSGGVNSLLRSEIQNTILMLGAGESGEWTFKYPFDQVPVLATSIVTPGGTPTGAVWCAGISSTSATYYNGTSQSISLHITATRRTLQ